LVFLVLAIAFIAIGLSGQRAFIYVGIAFLAVAILRWLPRRTWKLTVEHAASSFNLNQLKELRAVLGHSPPATPKLLLNEVLAHLRVGDRTSNHIYLDSAPAQQLYSAQAPT